MVAISGEDAKRFKSLAGVKPHVVPVVMTFERTRARTRQAALLLCRKPSLEAERGRARLVLPEGLAARS